MSKEDIDKAVREAEQFAAEDAKRKEEVDTRNQGDQMVYQTEQALNELGDKVSPDEKAGIEAKLNVLKDALKGSDVSAIKNATEEVQKAFYDVSAKIYQQANPQGGAQQSYDPNAQQGGSAQGYQDADYEVVDDDQ
jgi:molecular chaperone DnaK